MMYNKKFIFGLTAGFSWAGLGAYRGVQDYNKKYKKDYANYVKNPKYYPQPKYYYVSCIGNSIGHLFFYINPFFIPISIITELYNVEKAIRGMNDDDN